MNKFLLPFLSLILSVQIGKANIYSCPPAISEIYFDGTTWYLEFCFTDTLTYITSFDSLFLQTSSGTSGFKQGIQIIPNQPIVITTDSLLTPLNINRTGDNVQVFIQYNNEYYALNDPLYWGVGICSAIQGPAQGQSLKMIKDGPYTSGSSYHLVLDNYPTLGADPFTGVSHSTFKGYCKDSNGSPVSGVVIHDDEIGEDIDYSDSTGYFENTQLIARCYYISIHPSSNYYPYSTTISLLPDAIFQHNYTLILVNSPDEPLIDQSVSFNCHPNPFDNDISFEITLSASELHKSVIIKIFDVSGELVNILPVQSFSTTGKSICKWNGEGKYTEISSGEYISVLYVDGKKKSSQNIILRK